MHYLVPVNGTGQSASPFWLPLPATEAARLLGKGGERGFLSFSAFPLLVSPNLRHRRLIVSSLNGRVKRHGSCCQLAVCNISICSKLAETRSLTSAKWPKLGPA